MTIIHQTPLNLDVTQLAGEVSFIMRISYMTGFILLIHAIEFDSQVDGFLRATSTPTSTYGETPMLSL